MNLSRSQFRGVISLGSAAFGLSSAYRDLRKARSDGDRLALLDSVLSLAAVLTGLAIAARSFRDDGSD